MCATDLDLELEFAGDEGLAQDGPVDGQYPGVARGLAEADVEALILLSPSGQPSPSAVISAKPSRRHAARTSGSGTAAVSMLTPTSQRPA